MARASAPSDPSDGGRKHEAATARWQETAKLRSQTEARSCGAKPRREAAEPNRGAKLRSQAEALNPRTDRSVDAARLPSPLDGPNLAVRAPAIRARVDARGELRWLIQHSGNTRAGERYLRDGHPGPRDGARPNRRGGNARRANVISGTDIQARETARDRAGAAGTRGGRTLSPGRTSRPARRRATEPARREREAGRTLSRGRTSKPVRRRATEPARRERKAAERC